jgi:hypothetical protein
VGSDDGVTLVRARVFRAILTCSTCKAIVAVGPPVTGDGPDAAYMLGATEGIVPLVRHFEACPGGALSISFEQGAIAPLGPRHLRSVR